jgi:hypothetical protein
MFLDYAALFMVCFVVIFVFYAIIVIHDIPYEIAKGRNHPHQDAIHVTGWVSMFTLHALWPLLWIWSTLYREDRGWGFGNQTSGATSHENLEQRLDALNAKLQVLDEKLNQDKSPSDTISTAKLEQRLEALSAQLRALEGKQNQINSTKES